MGIRRLGDWETRGFVILLFFTLVACRSEPQPTLVVVATPTEPLSPPVTQTPLPAPVSPAPTITPTAPTPTIPPTVAPTPTPSPTFTTGQSLDLANLPTRDLNGLALKFSRTQKSGQEALVSAGGNFNLGDTDTFWVSDNSLERPKQFQITARVAYLTDHTYWWVQDGYSVSEGNLIASATQFEEHTYPTNRSYFGEEWSPGIDDDVRIHVLLGHIPGVGGYYASSNEYSRLADEYSNQREMFLINLDALQPGNERFDGVLAHEFQHMIHWNQDPNEDGWLNEGLSELAQYINGYGLSSFVTTYLNNPDTQLTAWGIEARTTGVNYGYSFLFSAYFLDKLGPEAITSLVAHPDNGITGINRTLQEIEAPINFDALFADFIVANYLNIPELEAGQWGYTLAGFDLPAPQLDRQHNLFPAEVTTTVNQFGVDYIEIVNPRPERPMDLTVTFEGATSVPLLNNRPYDGRYQWYSNRGDAIDTTLTRVFDLSQLTQATLTFWAWYDIESDWDYAYVAVSTDEGQTWDILPATTTTDTNLVGNAYGAGFTGSSGPSPQWVEERVDLSPYVGQEILLRFEYITDDAVNLPGLAIDNISIPELGYIHGAETGSGAWVAEGFIRTDNILPQNFIVQVIEFGSAGRITVKRMPLDLNNRGEYRLQGVGREIQRAIVVISAQAPVTTNPAGYTYSILDFGF